MANRIPGNSGTDPQGGTPSRPPVEPAPGTGPDGVLVIEGDRAFVHVGNQRIPVDITSALRNLGQTPVPATRRRRHGIPQELAPVVDAVEKHRAAIEAVPGVIAVRAGYKFDASGKITKTPAIVVSMLDRSNASQLPAVSFEVDVTAPDPYDLLRHERPGARATEAFAAFPSRALFIEEIQRAGEEAEEIARVITYRPPAGASLPEVEAAMAITCHVSPDAGWRVLRPFLAATREEFLLGMYDFTAPHIYQTIRGLLSNSRVKWTMTLGPKESLPADDDDDSTKADDKTEASVVRGLNRVAGGRFQSAFARVGSGATFASAYHIKVGVRDGSAFWLSSGNWQSSNQPDLDFLDDATDRKEIARYNREWHVVVENERLAEVFAKYLEGDFDTASRAEEAALFEAAVALPDLLVPEAALFAEEREAARTLQVFPPKRFTFDAGRPLKIQPILTPDNYIRVVRDLLRTRPRKTLYFQNQSLNPVKQPTEEFDELLQTLIEYSNDRDLDMRIIFRNIGPVRKKLESLQAAGFNMERVKMQAGCHTKGIIIDSERVLIGSHNFTNDGVQFNRDASLLIHDEGIAKYYEDIFLHDWERLARSTMRPEMEPILADGTESAPRGYVRVPWTFYDETD